MKIKISIVTNILIACCLTSVFGQKEYDLLSKMIANTKQIKTIKFDLITRERINLKTIDTKMSVKINNKPYKIYIKQEYPNKDMEILYLEGSNKNQALVHPNSFPYVNLKLDPYGSLMRKDLHHTVLETGFDYFLNILECLLNEYRTSKKYSLSSGNSVKWDGNDCYQIIFENTNFKFVNYKVDTEETPINIAKKKNISDYMILEKNLLSDYSASLKGKSIKIPVTYASKMILYIDKVRMIPLYIKIFDDAGFYEQYEYYKVQINPAFNSQEFLETYKDYNF